MKSFWLNFVGMFLFCCCTVNLGHSVAGAVTDLYEFSVNCGATAANGCQDLGQCDGGKTCKFTSTTQGNLPPITTHYCHCKK